MSKKTSTNKQTIDPRISKAAGPLIGMSKRLGKLPFVPNRGITIAGFNPQQQAAFDGIGQAAAAYGMPSSSQGGIPAPTMGADGISGYSTGPSYDQMMGASMPQSLINRFMQR